MFTEKGFKPIYVAIFTLGPTFTKFMKTFHVGLCGLFIFIFLGNTYILKPIIRQKNW